MSKPSYATYVKDRLNGFGGTATTFVYQDSSNFRTSPSAVFRRPGSLAQENPGVQTHRSALRDAQGPRDDVDNLKAAALQGEGRGDVIARPPPA